MDNNWIVENLTNAFDVWNSKMTEMWSLLTESPQTFKGGTIWQTMEAINGGMQAMGYGLLVLFFAIGIFRSASGFRDFQRPEHLLRHFIYFVLAKLGITYGMDLLVDVFDVCNGIVATAAGSVGGLTGASVALPQEIADAIGDVGFLASIPLWLVTLLGSLLITVLAFIMILTVYGRFFKIYMYAALSPVALASFAGEGTSHFGKAFLRSYVGVCMEGAVIVLACIIFSAFSSSGTSTVDSSASVVTQVWSYLGEVIFNLLVLVGLVKSADHIAKDMKKWWQEVTLDIVPNERNSMTEEKQLDLMRKQLKNHLEQQNQVCGLLERGVYTEEMFLKRNAVLQGEIKELQSGIEELEIICHNKGEYKQAREIFLPTTAHILDYYDRMTPEEKNRLWKLLMEKITYYRNPETPDRVEIHLYPRLGRLISIS